MIVSLDDTIECCVYTGKATPEAIETLLSRRFSSVPRDDFIEVGSHLIEVRRSEEKWPEEEQVVFMQWPVNVELYGDHDDPSGFTDLTTTVLTTLWAHGYPAVAACHSNTNSPGQAASRAPSCHQNTSDRPTSTTMLKSPWSTHDPPTPVEVRSFLMKKGKMRKGKRDLAFIPIEDWSSALRGTVRRSWLT